MNELSWIEISQTKLLENLNVIRRLIGDKVKIMVCVKGNAYGHGLLEVSSVIRDEVDLFSVVSVKEAKILRENGIKKPIVIMGYVGEGEAKEITNLNLSVFVWDTKQLKSLSKKAKESGEIFKVHLKVDTGMGRLGVSLTDFQECYDLLQGLEGLQLEGICTHFASSGTNLNNNYFGKQKEIFDNLTKVIKDQTIVYHSANSGAILTDIATNFDLVRFGIAAYGYYPDPEVSRKCKERNINLSPILTFKTKVIAVKNLKKGEFVGYDSTFKAEKDIKIAVLPIGYSDGFDRKLSNKGHVLIKGKRSKVVGRVSMNLTVVDISGIKDVKLEDEAVVIGKQGGDEITVEEIAKEVGTINYEITTRLRESIPRFII